MLIRLLAVLALAFAMTTHAAAQSEGDDFCASTPTETLSVLDGNWSLRQGPGFVLSAVGAIPLPAQPGQTLTMQFVSDAGYSTLSGQGQQLVMVGGMPQNVAPVAAYLDEEQAEGFFTPGPGCNWLNQPVMIGSKRYDLTATIPGDSNPAFYMPIPISDAVIIVCVRADGSIEVGEGFGANCGVPDQELDGEGELNMTLIVKFQSPSSATGVLIFTGNSRGNRFYAKAPITMTR